LLHNEREKSHFNNELLSRGREGMYACRQCGVCETFVPSNVKEQ
jgi:hypothetical protein